MKTPEICEDERRRQNVRDHKGADGQPDLNGIEYIEVGDGPRVISLNSEQISSVQIRIRQLGVLPDCLIIVRASKVPPCRVCVCYATLPIGACKSRIEAQCLIEIGDRIVVLAPRRVNDTSPVIGRGRRVQGP